MGEETQPVPRTGDGVKGVTRRFFGKIANQARLYVLVDFILVLGFAGILLTGLVISTWLNLPAGSGWVALHVAVSLLTLLAVVVKVGLHWRWIAQAMKKLLAEDAAPLPAPVAAKVAGSLNRREFLKVMGVVAVAAAGPLAISLLSLEDVEASSDGATVSDTGAVNQAGGASQTAACVVQCSRRCSYPGKCRRYVDQNGNNRCDLGECL